MIYGPLQLLNGECSRQGSPWGERRDSPAGEGVSGAHRTGCKTRASALLRIATTPRRLHAVYNCDSARG